MVNLGGHNYEAAEAFGLLVPITEGNVNHFNVDRLAVSIVEKLHDADEEDYVVISGSPLLNVVVTQLWLRRFKKLKLLQYSVRQNNYVVRLMWASALTRLAEQVGV